MLLGVYFRRLAFSFRTEEPSACRGFGGVKAGLLNMRQSHEPAPGKSNGKPISVGRSSNPRRLNNNPREHRPPTEGKTDVGCERTWEQINTTQVVYLLIRITLRGEARLLPANMPAVVGGSLSTDTKRARRTKLDESKVLFSRGTLCRENPMSARGMKQDLRVIQGINR
jgi:hypothetical protein